MNLIWFNPDINKFQRGNRMIYRAITSNSEHPERFTLVTKLNNGNESFLDKIVNKLNAVRAA